MINKVDRNKRRQKRHLRIRNKVSGTTVRPRLTIYKSNKHIHAQIIDDSNGNTLVAASSLDKDLNLDNTSNQEAAKAVGQSIGKKAIDQGIDTVVFDRSGYIYHGKIKDLAEAARQAGLKF